MTEVLEPVSVPAAPTGHNQSCPFCSADKPPEGTTSKIGADNSAKELEDSLGKVGEPRSGVNFSHEDYGTYSAEPHHLVSGNEALKGHPVERWLSTKAAGSYVNADSGFNVNSERNGIWLPSITDVNRICSWQTTRVNGKLKRVPAESETGKTMWSTLSADEKDLIAFAIMGKERLQFHKGNHRNKGAVPEECYIREVKRLLNEIHAYAVKVRKFCPEAKPDANGKYPPPAGLNEFIYAYASNHMRWHVSGPPQSWFVFVSALSRNFYQHAIDGGARPWPAPYAGHPDH